MHNNKYTNCICWVWHHCIKNITLLYFIISLLLLSTDLKSNPCWKVSVKQRLEYTGSIYLIFLVKLWVESYWGTLRTPINPSCQDWCEGEIHIKAHCAGSERSVFSRFKVLLSGFLAQKFRLQQTKPQQPSVYILLWSWETFV